MKWFDKLFRRPPKNFRYATTLNGLVPVYSQFGTNIYASDVVQQAIKCIVDEIKKLNPTHVRYKGDDPVPIRDSSINDVLLDPNPYMTTSDFLEKITWILLMNYNAFIVPIYRSWPDNGNERRELIVDAKDIQKEEDETIESYNARLKARGAEKLLECKKIIDFAFKPFAKDFGVKYDLGDILTVLLPEYGIKLQSRVVRFAQKVQNNQTMTTIDVGNLIIKR